MADGRHDLGPRPQGDCCQASDYGDADRGRPSKERNRASAIVDVRRQHEHGKQTIAHAHRRDGQPASQAGDGVKRNAELQKRPSAGPPCPASFQANDAPKPAVAQSDATPTSTKRAGPPGERTRQTVSARSTAIRPKPATSRPAPTGRSHSQARQAAAERQKARQQR